MSEEHGTVDLAALARESHKAFAVKDFKTASRIFHQIRSLNQYHTYVQMGDGAIGVAEKNEDGTDKTDPRTGELVLSEIG